MNLKINRYDPFKLPILELDHKSVQTLLSSFETTRHLHEHITLTQNLITEAHYHGLTMLIWYEARGLTNPGLIF